MKTLAAVIPALEKNRYSNEGDLMMFGELSLLEWKILQVKKVFQEDNIYVSTPSTKIEKVVKKYGINIIKRKKELEISEVIYQSVKGIISKHILWTHATSPFFSSKHYEKIIKSYFSLDTKLYDSIAASYEMRDYFIYNSASLNFDIRKHIERKHIDPVYKITNGCFIAPKQIYLKYKKFYGIRPFLFNVNKFTSMEISDIDDNILAMDFISIYFKNDLR